MNTIHNRRLKVPAGKYWVGDPCYVVRDEEWYDVCDHSDLDTPAKISNGITFCFNTQYGDGEYVDQHKRRYPVDSGTIGLTSFEHNPTFDPKQYGSSMAHLVEFKEEVECTNYNGVITLGDIVIDTLGNFEEEYDENYTF